VRRPTSAARHVRVLMASPSSTGNVAPEAGRQRLVTVTDTVVSFCA
jgi:hypothetical protein